jgi:hypothetical protein
MYYAYIYVQRRWKQFRSGAQLRREARQLLKVGGTCPLVPNGSGATVFVFVLSSVMLYFLYVGSCLFPLPCRGIDLVLTGTFA